MARINKGDTGFPARFSWLTSKQDLPTFDLLTDLIVSTNWEELDGNIYVARGFIASVINDTADNNGVYILLGTGDYTIQGNWISIGGSSEGEMTVVETSTNYEANINEMVRTQANEPCVMLPSAVGERGKFVAVKNDKNSGSTYVDAPEAIDGFTKKTSVKHALNYANSHYFNGGIGVGNSWAVGCHNNNSWVKIDVATQTQTSVTQTDGAYGLATDGTIVYGAGSRGTSGTIVSFNPDTDVETLIALQSTTDFRAMAVDTANSSLWATDRRPGNQRRLYRYSLTGTHQATVTYSTSTSGEPTTPVVVGGFIYVALSNILYKINTSTNVVDDTFTLSSSVYISMAYNPNNGFLYISTTGSTLMVFNTSTELEETPLNRNWNYVGVNPTTNILYGEDSSTQVFQALDVSDSYNELISYDITDTGRWVGHTDNAFWSFDTNNITEFSSTSYYIELEDSYQSFVFISNGTTWNVYSNYIDFKNNDFQETFEIDSSIISDEYIDLTNTPSEGSVILFYDGLEEFVATGTNPEDGLYTVDGNRITFNDITNDLYVGARIDVKYKY